VVAVSVFYHQHFLNQNHEKKRNLLRPFSKTVGKSKHLRNVITADGDLGLPV
jgi:hypothetical protein